MIRWLRRLINSSLVLLVLAGLGFAFIPNPARLFVPQMFGYKEVAPNVLVPPDANPTLVRQSLARLQEARARVERFYGTKIPGARIVLCLGLDCDPTFGRQSVAGTAHGNWSIRINSRLPSVSLLAHELSHIVYADKIGNIRLTLGLDPHWFNEGLAEVVAGDPVPRTAPNASLRDAMLSETRWFQWYGLTRRFGFRDLYQAALYEVAAIERAHGPGSLLRLVAALEGGQTFEGALRDLDR